MKKIIITLCFVIAGFGAFAQSELGPALSSQLFSRVNFNPAGIGNSPDINIFNMSRLQWAGFEGAPQYTVLNIQTFNDFLRSGFGGTFSYDQLGVSNRTINAKLAYNYGIDINDKAILSFGAAAGVLQKGNDFSNHTYIPEVGMPEPDSKINPDFDFGLEFSTPMLLVGASINHLGYMDEATSLTPTHAYYAYARGYFDVAQKISLSPSVLFMNSGLTNVIDVNTIVFYDKTYWGGFSYRIGAGIAAMVGLEWKFLRVGYSYELSFGTTTINSNTHEIMLSGVINRK